MRTDVATLWLDEHGWVVVDQDRGVVQTADTALMMMAAVRELVPEPDPAYMLVISNQSRATRGARKVFADTGATLIGALAMVVDSRVAEMTGNFFIRIEQPAFPMRLFNDRAAGKEWLAAQRTHAPRA